jgi:hypothetical protein
MNRSKIFLLAAFLLILAFGFQRWIRKAHTAFSVLGLNNKLLGSSDSASALPPPRAGSILWSADMETGDLSQWSLPDVPDGPNTGGGVFNSGVATASVEKVTLAHGGLHSAKLFIDTQKSSEIPTSGTRLFRWLEPQTHPELYYSVWYLIPSLYKPDGNPPWWNVFQWKSKRAKASGSDPIFALNIGNRSDGSMYFYLYNPITKSSYGQSLKDIPEGRWFHLEAFYKCAGDNSGHVTFWQDGTRILDVPNVQTRYADGDCAWSVNNYSSSLDPPQATIFVDDAEICSGNRCP